MTNKRLQQRKEARRQSARRMWLIGIALVGLGLAIFLAAQPPATGQTPLFSTSTFTGEPVSLNDYQGKVVMLNFWATWCPPCRAEMPVIEAAYRQYRDDGFVVLAINNSEDTHTVGAFAQQFGLSFPVLMDTSARIQRQFGITGYPTSLFLDASGQVYQTHSGMLSEAQIVQYIETGLRRSAG
ncbi:MAG: TlpA family protein disulfide reductase [Chloroflexi bacterium]|nr:TlpA family protein disulfide reductase [Chloroflexota bacterium]